MGEGFIAKLLYQTFARPSYYLRLRRADTATPTRNSSPHQQRSAWSVRQPVVSLGKALLAVGAHLSEEVRLNGQIDLREIRVKQM